MLRLRHGREALLAGRRLHPRPDRDVPLPRGGLAGYANSGYTDVPETSYCAAPVAWAVVLRITSGTGTLTFSPDNLCTRAQIVTFLYRANA